jgi:hypothetical protein
MRRIQGRYPQQVTAHQGNVRCRNAIGRGDIRLERWGQREWGSEVGVTHSR